MKGIRVFVVVVSICVGMFFFSSIYAHAGVTSNLGKMAGKAADSVKQLLDINSATVEQLQQLPGVGEKIAERIVKYREENGPFSKVEDLLKVEGIGEKKLEKIKLFIEIIKPDEKKQ